MNKVLFALVCFLSACSSQVSLGSQEEGALSPVPEASVSIPGDAGALAPDVATGHTGDASSSAHPPAPDAHADALVASDVHPPADASPDGPDAAHYNGCAGKACGVACTVCDPHDAACIEPPGAKMCNPHEQCVTALICP
jgi:hypothetical protein